MSRLEASGIVERLLTDWYSSLVVVKPGPGAKFRMCIDYTGMNRLTCTIKYSVPIVNDIL